MRVFRRPMFRRGGTTNQGIMTGLVDRRRYDMGAFGRAAKEYATDIQSIMGTPDINQLLIQGGLGLVGGQGTGQGALADVATAFQKPTAQYFQQAMANKMAAKKLGVEMAMKERLAKQKAMAGPGKQKENTNRRNYNELYKKYTDPKLAQGFRKTIGQIRPHQMSLYGSYILDDRVRIEKALKAPLLGVVPHTISGNKEEYQFENMASGGIYFAPDNGKFYQRVIEGDKNFLISYNPKTLQAETKTELK